MARNNSSRTEYRPKAGGSDGRPLHSEGALAGIKLANEKLESEKATLLAKLAENKQEIEDLKTQLTAAKEFEVKLASATLAAEKLEKDVAASKEFEAKASAEIVETKCLLHKANSDLDTEKAAKAAWEAELDAVKAAKAASEAELNAVKTEKAACEAELDAVKAAKAASEAELNAVKAAKAASEAELDETRKDLVASKVQEKSWRRAVEWFVAQLPDEVQDDFLHYRGIDMRRAMEVLEDHEEFVMKEEKKKRKKEEKKKRKKEKEKEMREKEEEREKEQVENFITELSAMLRKVFAMLRDEVMEFIQDRTSPSPARHQTCTSGTRANGHTLAGLGFDMLEFTKYMLEFINYLRSASPAIPEMHCTRYNQQGDTRHIHTQYGYGACDLRIYRV